MADHDTHDHTGVPGVGGGGGAEIDYVQYTSNVSITATSEATANTVATATATAFDGSTIVYIEFFAPTAQTPAVSSENLLFALYDGSSSIGLIGQVTNTNSATLQRTPVFMSRRLTPSAATHTYSIRAYVGSGTGSVNGGSGGAAAYMPGYIRIIRAV